MAVAGDLVVNLSANSRGVSRGVRKAMGTLRGFASSAAGLVAGLGTSVAGAIVAAGVAGAVASVTTAVKALKAASNFEKTAVAFKVLTGSAQNAAILLGDIRKFAASTPFQFNDLATAGKKLIAFNTPLNEIVPTLRQLGNLASGLDIPIGELSEIFGKARVQGRLFGEDINQLTGRGIPVIQEFAKQFGVGTSEVKKLVAAGKIGFPQLQKAIESLTTGTGKFAGLTKEQSNTLSGLFSTLKDNVGGALIDLGNEIVKTFDVKAMVGGLVGFMQTLKNDWIPAVAGVFRGMRMLWDSTIGFMRRTFGGLFGAGGDILSTLNFTLRNFDLILKIGRALFTLWAGNVRQIFRNLAGNAFTVFRSLVSGIGKLFVNLFTQTLANAKEFGKQLFNAIKGKGFDASKFGFDLLKGARGDFAKIGGLLTKGAKKSSPELVRLFAELAKRAALQGVVGGGAGKLPGGGGGKHAIAGASVKQGAVEGAIRGSSEFFRRLTEIRTGRKNQQEKQLAVLKELNVGIKKIAANTRQKNAAPEFNV